MTGSGVVAWFMAGVIYSYVRHGLGSIFASHVGGGE